MNKQELIKKIIQKKEFSQLPKKDVELAFSQFDKDKYLDIEKIKFTRDLLRKVFSGFASQKLLSLRQKQKLLTTSSNFGQSKDKDAEWILRKHLSTKERLYYYEELYKRVLNGLGKKISVIDLGAGVNGFSYKFFKKIGHDVSYVSVESVGQLVKLVNYYFENEKIKARAIHLSLFEINKIKKIIKGKKKPRVVFLFKTIDSLEMLKRDYSKELISEIIGMADRVVVSFATRSMIKRKKFRAKRNWFIDFIKKNFDVLADFELDGERYAVFCKSKKVL